GHLLRRTLEIRRDRFAALMNRNGDADILSPEPIIVHHISETIITVRHFPECHAHTLVGANDDLVEQAGEIGSPLLSDDALKAPDAELSRGNLGVEIAQALLRQTHV